ncbi:hypothetical protein ABEW24_06410 [Paenibacillus jamilae]|uniref:hypothetical protein n=1 Tax=Paenibacillus TaxID=44249 RepID=UPI00077C9664|nr:hypothetical protein [Paenibacillus polymyxa]KYG93728.1 hypothetical protein AZE31_07725 [Paenibacillus polymyxa]
MASHISLEFKDESRLVDFLKLSYSAIELAGICRSLNLDKDDILNKFLPHKENCSNLVDSVRQHGLYSNLFSVLQTKQFHRERFSEVFPEFYTTVVDNTRINQIRLSAFEKNDQTFKYADWLQESKEKTVLILGKDSPDEYMQQLIGISETVKELGYHPILIKKQPEIRTISNEEKMLAYASISRFVIIEKSFPAGQIDEAKICAFNRIPSIWIHQEGTGDTWMQGDYEVDFKFIKSFAYNASNHSDIIYIAIKWMEEFLKEKEEYLDLKYPWRN